MTATARLAGALALAASLQIVTAEILTPPYFNLAQGKKISATATCGDDGSELYCKLVGANIEQVYEQQVIGGQTCDYCDANLETKRHPPEYAVDGMETWWQSPPLSRGMKYNEVNLTIDLGQEFHVAYVFVRMGNSPRPGLWALEKSTDYGKTYKPWQYFSDSPQDCERFFGKESIQPITRDDSVICSTEYSKIVPLEGGEIPISLLNNRPSANTYFKSTVLQEWTRATNVRLRLLRTKNLLAHLMSVARQDPTVTRRYFYSIKDISIGGRCMCNGHADTCDPADPESESSILVCRCQHNTCGPQCAQCCPGFEQKKWRISQEWNKFACEPCNCHNHTTECIYDPEVDEKHLSLDIHGQYEGGGICLNCQHNTEGNNCNKCKPTFYRPTGKTWSEIDVCAPCNCDLHYSTGNCAEETGQCECREEFQPPFCNSCAYGYYDYPNCKRCECNLNGTEGPLCNPTGQLCPCKYNYAGQFCEICADGYYSPECKSCECNMLGSVSAVCDKDSGNCTCKSKYAGRTCNQCEAGYYNYPTCSHCNCDTSGTLPNICDDITGQCICKEGFGGARCDQCLSGYYMIVRARERVCVPCNCSAKGSTSTSCSADGKCNCLSSFGGKQCDQCSPGHYKYPECLPCYCDFSGSVGTSCDDNGQCLCKPNFDGSKCDHCKEQFYNYPACEECNCDPRGVIASFSGCGSVPAGELCQCKNRVQGRICNDCKPLFWNLQEYNPNGCEECKCHLAGTVGGLGVCNTKTGQCTCKLHVGDRRCDQCQDGFYQLQGDNIFGCTECDCDVGGSIDNICDKFTGQCRCNSRVEGRRCDRPIRAYYFPTLHQFQYEIEEGLTPSGPVRYRSSEDTFPEYSWKGYVVFSFLQNEVINIVNIAKPSLYRIVLKYANPLKDPVVASVIVTPESIGDTEQKYNVLLRTTQVPQLVTVAGEKGNAPAPFVMNPGNWTVTIKTTKEVLIDYFVLVPQAYYEATVLTKQVDKPCVIGGEMLCRHFAYPNLNTYPSTDISGLVTDVTNFVDDQSQLKELGVGIADIPIIDNAQSELQYNMVIEPNGQYVLVVEYVTPINKTSSTALIDPEIDPNSIDSRTVGNENVIVRFQSGDGIENVALVNLYDCPYTTPCRQVIIDDLSKINIFSVQDKNNVIYLQGVPNTLVGIKSIIAIPESEWHLDYITAKPFCLRRNKKCEPAVFPATVDSKKVEIESGIGGDRKTTPPILDNSTVVVYLSPNSEPLTIEAKVSSPGEYLFVVHYYQPNHPEGKITLTLSTGDEKYDATIPIEHCPSNSGCRALIKQADDVTHFFINDNFTLSFKDTSKNVWLDYVLVVANSDFKDTVLKEANKFDYTREFISQCAMNHYKIDTNDTGFCRDAVFSITADYNSGTLGCFCHVYGSLDFECDTFGGQCKCKPNVIGRTCSACKTRYYGHPNCKPCNCPLTAVCDDNGQCICPKNVEGENCDRCKPLTFNFDVQRGCDDCNCNPYGVEGNQLQCDKENGNCGCKKNVIGRTCDHCVPGHYAFPECYQCSCNLGGTTDDVCDQETAQCYCKKNVKGTSCDECKEDHFNLQSDNPVGCTKCHCFGKTTRCTSAPLFWSEITGMSDWQLLNIEKEGRTLEIFPHMEQPKILNESVIGAEFGNGGTEKKVVYFGAPGNYLGKRLTSYGGYLKYAIFYTSNNGGNAVFAADVIIGGPNGYLVHNSIEQPPALENWIHEVKISEDEFTNVDGSAITKEQFMNTLVNITAIYIRATYWDEAVTTRLIAVSLDYGEETPSLSSWGIYAQPAFSVEQCQCPPAYKGLSCEECAEGHYRLSSGPHAGLCVPCQCNGHTNACDVNTGICLDCQQNTMGDHCEQCIPGYHGDATQGTRDDCLICACPLPYTSNNFAHGCELSDNGALISCDCKPGYGGPRCEFCAAGYYGIPENIGDYCKPCNCSGNINVEDPGSCDTINGDCLKCVNNTSGAACNLCAPGFFGDAIFSKNCTACDCDEFGMDHCDSSTGTCVCRPGVIGDRCDQCEPNHWGINTGQGCTPCDCDIGSLSPQCDGNTGQCMCAKNVTGLHCDQCAPGFWNYTKYGCDDCNCNTGYAKGFRCSTDGRCECLPGVIGEKCDRCPERWVLIPNQGCQECDSCTDALIFSLEDMRELLNNETQDFKDKADSFFTTQRLNYISNQTKFLKPLISDMKKVDLEEVTSAVKLVENQAKNLLRSAEFAATDSEKQIYRAADLADDSEAVLSLVRGESEKASQAVAHVGELATGLELSQQPKVDSALAEARQIRDEMEGIHFGTKKDQALNVFKNAEEQLERMNIFVQPVNKQNKDFGLLLNNTRGLKDKLEEMLQYIDIAQHKVDAAERLNANNRASKFENKVNSVAKQSSVATKNLLDAAYSIANASALNFIAQNIGENFGETKKNLDKAIDDMKNRLNDLKEDLPNLKEIFFKSKEHANSLNDRADDLRQLANQENNNTRTRDAYSAASAYSLIVDEINQGKNLTAEAEGAIAKALEATKKIRERVAPAYDDSNLYKERAAQSLEIVKQELSPHIARAEKGLNDAKKTLTTADNENQLILQSLRIPPDPSLLNEIQKADNLNATIINTLQTMSQMGGDLDKSKEFAQRLPTTAHETEKMKQNTETLLAEMSTMNPENLINIVKAKQDDLDAQKKLADEKLQRLKDLIDQARSVANRIQVGVSFDSTSTLQPRLPDTIDEMSTSTHVSAFFKTAEKNGLILYLGNPKDTSLKRTKSDDFMVLEIQNGYPYLVMDIGDGADSGREPARIRSDVYVADNRWYQVIVDRVGRSVKLSIRESLENGSDVVYPKEAVLPGQQTIFNLDKEKSKLYVGGAPSDALPKLQGISYPAFEGQIEELVIGSTPVGLWNFESSANLRGARQRDKLITSQSGPQEYRFNGRGHVTIKGKKYLQPDKNLLLLYFKTYAPDGLIYLVGDQSSYFSVYMKEGHVVLEAALEDNNVIKMTTTKHYNDGKWHKLDTARFQRAFSLHVDNDPPIKQQLSSSNTNIYAIDTMRFGGDTNGIVPIKGFDGCIRQISIDRVNIDLSENIDSIGFSFGCQFASLVSLSGENSFLHFVNVTEDHLQMTLKFKTSEPDGLIFVYFSRTQTPTNQDSISLSLVKGGLKLMSQREVLDTGLNTYNDSHWHVVSVTHSETALKMVVDDFDYFSTDAAPATMHILEGVLFVGGLQPGYVMSGKVGSKAPFSGCIADATLNGQLLNLLEPYNNNSVTFGRCGSTTTSGGMSPDQIQWPVTSRPDILPTVLELPTESNLETVERNEITTTKAYGSREGKAPIAELPTLPSAMTTVRSPPVTRKPPPAPEQGCALAYDPQYTLGDPDEGYRFGTRNDSRIEYARLPGRQHDGFDLTITFRTFDKHGGLIFYAAAEKSPQQFLAVYMKDGKMVMAFNCGAETVFVKSNQSFADTEWHTVTIVRNGGGGKVSVDNEQIGQESGMCYAPAALAPPFYYGGLREITQDIKNNLEDFYQSFKGCLKGLMMNGQKVTDILHRVNSLQCRDDVEDGVYFGPSTSDKTNYLVLDTKFRVGREMSISLEIKPRNSTGLLLSIHGTKDFLVLELLENEVVATVENGKGQFHASYKLGTRNSLCDGKWHKIKAVKSNHVVSVGVDGHFSDPGIGQSGSTDTRNNLYIGGHERHLAKVTGVRSRRGFVGCIREIRIKDKVKRIPLNAAHGNVHVGVCPTD